MRRSTLFVTLLVIPVALLVATLVTQADGDDVLGGSVLDPKGRPLVGAEVRLRIPEGSCQHVGGLHVFDRTETGENGRFTLRRPAGDMEIYVAHPDFAPAWTDAVDGAVVRMREACWVEGEIATPAMLTVSRGPWHFVHEEIHGRFRCGPLPADQVLSVGVVSNTHRPYSARFVLGHGETRAMNVALDPGVSVRGNVHPPDLTTTIRAHGRDGQAYTAVSDEEGRFEIKGLAPGWVRLVAMSTGHPVQVLDSRTGETVDVRWSR